MKINNKIKSLFSLSLVGSSLGKENNQTGINLNNNQFPEMAVNLTKRQNNPDPTLIFAGYPILVTEDHGGKKSCTASFAVLYTDSPDCEFGDDNGGFITSSLCSPVTDSLGNRVSTRDGSMLGDMVYMTFGRVSTLNNNFDYAYVSIYVDKNKLTPYTTGLTTNDKTVSELYPVIETSLPQLGIICAYGANSGYRCGSQVGSDLEITIPNPWNSGSTITFKGLNKIDMGTNGFESEEDHGGPVYLVGDSADKKIVINVLGHITWFDNTDPNHKLVYYTPIDKALSAIFENNKCSYNLLTYNEANTKEFQAQVEMPPKK
jgi:hypothetical protein